MSDQQVNAQSQSGSTCFSFPPGHNGQDATSMSEYYKKLCEAKAEVEKKIKVDVKGKEGGNAQGQGQIVQSDFNYLYAFAYYYAPVNGVAEKTTD